MHKSSGNKKTAGHDDAGLRQCRGCGLTKALSLDEFPKKDGRFSWRCRVCQREKDREKYKASSKKLEYVKRWRGSNPEKTRKSSLDYYYRNREKCIASVRAWSEKNPQKRKKYYAELHGRRQSSDPMYRLKRAVRAYLRICVLSGKVGKRTESLLGYSISELKDHLERQFVGGMNWSNYGEWHIDHIVPIAEFKFDSPEDEEFKRCWSLPNLRPLWGRDNIIKGSKRQFLL